MNSHLAMIGIREDIYAAAASAAFEQAESNAESYPVLYPEPFNTIGCGSLRKLWPTKSTTPA